MAIVTRASSEAAAAATASPSRAPALRLRPRNLASSLSTRQSPSFKWRLAAIGTPSHTPGASDPLPRKKLRPLRTSLPKLLSGTSNQPFSAPKTQNRGISASAAGSTDQRPLPARAGNPPPSSLVPPPQACDHRPDAAWDHPLLIRRARPGPGFQAQAPRPSPHNSVPPTTGRQRSRKSRTPPKGPLGSCQRQTEKAAGHATASRSSDWPPVSAAGRLLDGPDRQGGATEGSPAQIGQPVDKQCTSS